jgi:hypothetical protein
MSHNEQSVLDKEVPNTDKEIPTNGAKQSTLTLNGYSVQQERKSEKRE